HGFSTIGNLLKVSGTPPDFEYHSLSGGSKLVYIHRRIDDADVYFVSNQQYRTTEVECTFRIEGKWPELWHADTGVTERALVFQEKGNRTTVPLTLAPAESVFVVFRQPSAGFHLERFELEGVSRPVEKLPVVVIKKARYEASDGRGVDVTGVVADLVKQGNYEIPASNGIFGDP